MDAIVKCIDFYSFVFGNPRLDRLWRDAFLSTDVQDLALLYYQDWRLGGPTSAFAYESWAEAPQGWLCLS